MKSRVKIMANGVVKMALMVPLVLGCRPGNRDAPTEIPSGLPIVGSAAAEAQQSVPPNHQPMLVMQGSHTDPISSLALSTDGKWLVTGSHDHTASLWELSTGRLVRVFQGHTANIYCVALSKDGRRLATGGVDRIARAWELATGKEIRAFHGHRMNLTSVSLSGDGKLLASGSLDGTARVWNVDGGRQIQVFYHDSRNAAPLPKDKSDRCWINVVLSSDGTRLVTNSTRHVARLWEVATGKALRAFGNGSVGENLAWSGDGRWLATADGKIARLWNMEGKEIRSFPHAEYVRCVCLSSDGTRLATGAGTGNIIGPAKSLRVWDASSGKQITAFGPSNWVNAMDLSADGKRVVAWFHEPLKLSVDMWDADTGKVVGAFAGEKNIGCRNLALTADGRWLAMTNGFGSSVHLWNMAKGMQTLVLKTRFSTDPALRFSSDVKRLVAAYDGHAYLWNLSDGKLVREFTGQDEISSVAMSSDGKWLVTGRELLREKGLAAVQMWDLASGLKGRALDAHPNGVLSLALSADEKWLVTGGMRDGNARLWELATGKHLRDFPGDSRWWNEVALTRDAAFLITTSGKDNSVLLWHVASGKRIRTFYGHTSWVTTVALSGDGKWLVSGSDDRTARLWELATGKEERIFRGHSERVTRVALTADGKRLVTASNDETTRIWDVATGKQLCQLICFTDGGWAVLDTAGRFDAANEGDVDGLQWVIGRETFPLARYKNQYYERGLLAKHMGFNREPLREISTMP